VRRVAQGSVRMNDEDDITTEKYLSLLMLTASL
jgi:hypothetical protein